MIARCMRLRSQQRCPHTGGVINFKCPSDQLANYPNDQPPNIIALAKDFLVDTVNEKQSSIWAQHACCNLSCKRTKHEKQYLYKLLIIGKHFKVSVAPQNSPLLRISRIDSNTVRIRSNALPARGRQKLST